MASHVGEVEGPRSISRKVALRSKVKLRRDALDGERAKAGALCRDMASTIVVRERRIPSLEA